MAQSPSVHFSLSMADTGWPSSSAGPTRLATAMQALNSRRLSGLASSMRIITLVSRPSNTRGGAK
jgi:hypothetical protein